MLLTGWERRVISAGGYRYVASKILWRCIAPRRMSRTRPGACAASRGDRPRHRAGPGATVRLSRASPAGHAEPARQHARSGMSLCRGKIYGRPTAGRAGDAGAGRIRRADPRECPVFEALSDPAASRSLWYHFDTEMFVVSNSQRAITLYTGCFALDPEAAPGCSPPARSGRACPITAISGCCCPRAACCLDKTDWTLLLTEGEIGFEPVARSPEAAAAALRARRSRPRWRASARGSGARMSLALSGGADSRTIGALQRDAPPASPGRASPAARPRGGPARDRCRGRRAAAEAIGTRHRFIATHSSPEPVETVIDRYILAAEGRVDHLGGYLDGLCPPRPARRRRRRGDHPRRYLLRRPAPAAGHLRARDAPDDRAPAPERDPAARRPDGALRPRRPSPAAPASTGARAKACSPGATGFICNIAR